MDKAKLIAAKNDNYRQTFTNCKVVMAIGVAHNPHRDEILTAVRNFTSFTKANDPHGEHDFGSITVHGTSYFFKFDYYDENYQFFQEDGHRVLTIMRADEY